MGPEYPGEGAVKAATAGSNSDEGVTLVPINWDTLRLRKLEMEAWSNDTTKKEEKENQEKQENRYQVVLRAVFYLSVPGAITSSSHEETLWKLKTENEGVVK